MEGYQMSVVVRRTSDWGHGSDRAPADDETVANSVTESWPVKKYITNTKEQPYCPCSIVCIQCMLGQLTSH